MSNKIISIAMAMVMMMMVAAMVMVMVLLEKYLDNGYFILVRYIASQN